MEPIVFYARYDASDPFGNFPDWRQNPHRGSDVPQPEGTPIPSFIAGTVVRSTYHSGLGWVVVIRTAFGFYVGWSHLRERGILADSRVDFGTIIGVVGNTGTLSFGAHTHITGSWSSDQPWSGGVFDIWPTIFDAIHSKAPAAAAAAQITKRKRAPMSTVFIQNGTDNSDTRVFALETTRGDEPLRQIGFAEFAAGAASGIIVQGVSSEAFQFTLRSRGVLFQDKYLRPIAFSEAHKATVSEAQRPYYVNRNGFAVYLPNG